MKMILQLVPPKNKAVDLQHLNDHRHKRHQEEQRTQHHHQSPHIRQLAQHHHLPVHTHQHNLQLVVQIQDLVLNAQDLLHLNEVDLQVDLLKEEHHPN
jgi:Na+-translocating ferredoxin:NAD+ oxidoreductase RnfC subunit